VPPDVGSAEKVTWQVFTEGLVPDGIASIAISCFATAEAVEYFVVYDTLPSFQLLAGPDELLLFLQDAESSNAAALKPKINSLMICVFCLCESNCS